MRLFQITLGELPWWMLILVVLLDFLLRLYIEKRKFKAASMAEAGERLAITINQLVSDRLYELRVAVERVDRRTEQTTTALQAAVEILRILAVKSR